MNIERAKGAYESVRYPGDLAMELLPARGRLGWRMVWTWGIPVAVAAMVAVAIWPHGPTPQKPQPQVVKSIPTDAPVRMLTSRPSRPELADLRGLKYSLYLSQVRTGVEDAISQLGNGVDAVVDAPVVTDSVATVKQVAGEIQELASVTWSQLKPRSPGC